MTLILNSENIATNPWVWNFLESQRNKGVDTWKAGNSFNFKNQKFQFGQTVFARQRKNQQGYVYEMESPIHLGSGCYGSVNKISCTISQGKNNSGYQARDKNRVVKNQAADDARREYAAAQYTSHLHIKKPVNGRLVMRNLGESTLYKFLSQTKLNRQQKLTLTKELLRVVKE